MHIKVIPGSKKPEIEETTDMFGEKTFRIKLKSIPENGKANAELIEILSEYFKIPKSKIKITKGLKSNNKIVEI